MANKDYKNGKLIEIIREFNHTGATRYEINGINQAIAVPFWRIAEEKFNVIPKGSYKFINESGNNYLEITDNTILEQATQFQICYVYSQISSKYIEEFPELSVMVNKYNELVDDATKLFSYLKSVGMTSDTLQLTKVLSQLEPLTTWFMDNDGEIKTLPISDLYGKFQQMIDKLHKDIKDLLDIDYGKLSDNLKKELAKHLLTLEEALGKHKDSLDDYTLEKIKEIKATCDRIIGLAFSKLTKADTIEDLKTMRFLKVGDVIEVLGYYTAGDGAGHKRIIANEDDGSGVQLANDLWANIVHNGEVKTSWFGIKDDESIDDTPTFNKILNYADNIFVDRNVNVDKIVLPNNKTIYGKKISAVQIQIGYKCSIKNISLFSKESIEDIPFLYINGNDFPSTKSEILIKDIFITGKNLERKNKDFFVTEISDNHGIWGITVDGVRSEGRMNFRTIFKFKAHKSKINTSYYPWITYFDLRNVSTLGGINMLELLTYYTEDDEYGYISDDKGASIAAKVSNCHFESNGDAKTMLRLGSGASISMDENSFIGDFTQYSVDVSKYIIIDNRWSKFNLSGNKFTSLIKTWETNLINKYYSISFLDNSKKDTYTLFKNGNCVIQEFKSGMTIPDRILLDFQWKSYKIFHNFYDTGKPERYFILSKFKKTDLNIHFNITYISTNSANDVDSNVKFLSLSIPVLLSNAKFNTNMKKLKTVFLYEKDDEYYFVVKTSKDNYFDNLSVNLFLIGNQGVGYYFEGGLEEFNALGLTLTKEFSAPVNVSQLNTLYHTEKMKQENVYDDFITYMDEKTLYDKQQEKLEEQRQLAYQGMLKENPELTYEEFIAIQPMTLNLVEEPQPSQALREFMEKYL